MVRSVLLLLLGIALPAQAEIAPPPGQDIYVLGEVHDNPAHHATQARLVAQIAPRSVVWEMLSEEQAAALVGLDPQDAKALEAALRWSDSGWPDFAMYHPIFLAAGPARHLGASVPPQDLRRVMDEGLEAGLGAAEVAAWGLGPLPAAEQSAREAEQKAAHCDALPDRLLPGMVAAQRLRDWALASRAVAAVDAGQGPVVVITGSGHARKDRGVPALIAVAAPGLKVWSLGQDEAAVGEAVAGDAPFDAVLTAPPPPREDPCLAFQGG